MELKTKDNQPQKHWAMPKGTRVDVKKIFSTYTYTHTRHLPNWSTDAELAKREMGAILRSFFSEENEVKLEVVNTPWSSIQFSQGLKRSCKNSYHPGNQVKKYS